MGSRVSVQLFADDVLSHQGLTRVEQYPSTKFVSVVLADGAGLYVSLTGAPGQVRQILESALGLLDPAPELEGEES